MNKGQTDRVYFLNGQWKRLVGSLVPATDWSKQPETMDIGQLPIIADGIVVYDSGPVASDIWKSIKVNIKLTGVMKLEVKLLSDLIGPAIGLVNASFVK